MIHYIQGPVDYEAVSQQAMVLIPMVAVGVILLIGWTLAFRLKGDEGQ